MAVQPGLCRTWSEPKKFSDYAAYINFTINALYINAPNNYHICFVNLRDSCCRFSIFFSHIVVTEIKAKKARLEPESKGVNLLTTVSLDVDDKRAKLRAKIEELQGLYAATFLNI